jgi:hypothetical protein
MQKAAAVQLPSLAMAATATAFLRAHLPTCSFTAAQLLTSVPDLACAA